MTQLPKIRIRNLSKSFGSKVVLNGINLDVEEGESLVVIGGSGIGKSVLLKCILGLMIPDTGSIEVDGKEVISLDKRQREAINSRFGMLFQGSALFDSLTVWENVAFGVIALNLLNQNAARELAITKLKQVGMSSEIADIYPALLSSGMQKRVGLARAISTNPEIIFFDEPTTGLDPIMADVINNLIVKTTLDLGATCITITHDMASAQKIGHRIAMLYDGKIMWSGPSATVAESNNKYVDQFINGRSDGPMQLTTRE